MHAVNPSSSIPQHTLLPVEFDEGKVEMFDKKNQETDNKLLRFTREQNYSDWYYDVIESAGLAENSIVRGCMAIKPYGYAIWENIQRQLDDRFKADGIENAYFPLFIPLSFFQKEASHVAGFAKECAVVTHYRLKAKESELVQSVSSDLESARSRVSELEQTLIKVQEGQGETIQSVSSDLESARSRVSELEQTLIKVQEGQGETIQSVSSDLESARSRVSELEQTLIKVQKEQAEIVQSVSSNLESARSLVSELKETLSKAQEVNPTEIIPDDSALLTEPLVVRPTSETIIGHHFSKWIRSYNDLPLRINQWANVVRWEHQTKIFLRTSEILWQEGHTAHESYEQAKAEALKISRLYSSFMEENLAMPVIAGEKSPNERFAGAENSYTFEAMMQDGKALQAGTSHFLGQNFSRAFDIGFFNRSNERSHAYTTSWGVTTRLIGSVIMMHSDDDGLRLPPMIAPKQIVIIPAGVRKGDLPEELNIYIEHISKIFRQTVYKGYPLRVFVDRSQKTSGKKFWDSVVKGVPIRLEIGLRDCKSNTIVVSRRDRPHRSKESIPFNESTTDFVLRTLDEIQGNYFREAFAFQQRNTITGIHSFEELKKTFESMTSKSKFILAKWSEEPGSERLLEEINNASIRCIPFKQSGTEGVCVLTGNPATKDIIIAQSY